MKPVVQADVPSAPNLIIIGGSTGGTRVLSAMLGMLPRLRAAVLIVQHLPKFINNSFAASLCREARTEVRLAQDGDRLEDGSIYVAPSDVHCTVVRNRLIALHPGPKVNYVCPAIDVTMQSVCAPRYGARLIGVLLTGMGRDGAAGMAHLKKLGALTIAQDEASCAVYGMPAEAVQLGCFDYQLPPERIVQLLIREAGVLARPIPAENQAVNN